jgi:hypothetical protein
VDLLLLPAHGQMMILIRGLAGHLPDSEEDFRAGSGCRVVHTARAGHWSPGGRHGDPVGVPRRNAGRSRDCFKQKCSLN